MTVLKTNKPVWFDKEGGLLNEGYIYVGEPNKAPQDFPVTVTFEDSSGNQVTAAQPLRTDASGRIVYLGNPTIATVGEDYSLLILDSAQKQQDYIPSVDAGIITGSVDAKVYDTQAAAVADQTLVADMFVQTLDKTTPFDGDGADWRVVAYTGTPGDGIDLVDLDNGLQLKRLKNYLASNKNLEEISSAGATAQNEARSNINAVGVRSEVAGFSKAENVFVYNGGSDLGLFDVQGSMADGVYESIGKTGSAADNIWTALDSVPDDATFLILFCQVTCDNASGRSDATMTLRREGSTLTFGSGVSRCTTFVVDSNIATNETMVIVPINNGLFEASWTTSGAAASVTASVIMSGFGV
jgi:hypothetical protein